MPQPIAQDTGSRGQRVKGPHVPMDLPFWDECFSTSPLYSKPSADWNKKGRTVSHPEGQDGSQPPSPGARVLPAPCLVLQRAGANTTAPDKQCSAWMGQAHHISAHQLPPQVAHTVSSATALHRGDLCFSDTVAHPACPEL